MEQFIIVFTKYFSYLSDETRMFQVNTRRFSMYQIDDMKWCFKCTLIHLSNTSFVNRKADLYRNHKFLNTYLKDFIRICLLLNFL